MQFILHRRQSMLLIVVYCSALLLATTLGGTAHANRGVHNTEPATRRLRLTTTAKNSRQLQDDNNSNNALVYAETYFENNIDLNEVSLCGCASCYDRGESGYTTRTGEVTCAQRIRGLMMLANTAGTTTTTTTTNNNNNNSAKAMSEGAACTRVAKEEFAEECGLICDADMCDGRLQERDSSGTTTTTATAAAAEKTFCGCQTCTTDVWLTMAGEFSCGARVSYLTDFRGQKNVEACRQVGGVEFEGSCGKCNPDTCPRADPSSMSAEDPVMPTTVTASTNDFTALENSNHPFSNQVQQQSQSNVNQIALTPDFPLYCYPEYNQRMQYENVWGKYHLEVKESGNKCGPSDNLFSRDTVEVLENNEELKLQFKKVGNQWQGSEVRVLLPQEEMPYHYGEYSFSVKSIEVIDTTTGEVVDTTLPVTIILGLFTWDATEDYATHENYNHEVDVEIARWNIEELSDVQYLVQPPGDPHKYRFFSGQGGNTYHQAPHTYKFDWRPAEIEWNSDAGGGGHNFIYNSQMALDAGQPDYTQCMPADVEVRMNLWNLFGDSTPKGMLDTYKVEVVIDDFHFTPNGLTSLPDNGVCAKDCHCDSSSKCQKNKCVNLGGSKEQASTNTNNDNPTGQQAAQELDVPNDNPAGTQAAQEMNVSSATNAAESVHESDSSGKGGLQKAGKSLLAIGLLVAAGFVVFLLIRQRRSASDGSRIVLFTGGRGTDTKTKVVVECWEEDTARDSTLVEPSFEMSIKNKVGSKLRLFSAN